MLSWIRWVCFSNVYDVIGNRNRISSVNVGSDLKPVNVGSDLKLVNVGSEAS